MDSYGKIFRQIYGSTVAKDWRVLITFQQFLVLKDRDGLVDMPAFAIARTTGIPQDIIDLGIEELAKPDPMSRSKDEEGRRIVLIDAARDWGWRVVNHEYYQGLWSIEEKRAADRARQASKRQRDKAVTARDGSVTPRDKSRKSRTYTKTKTKEKLMYGEGQHVRLTKAAHDKLLARYGPKLDDLIDQLDHGIGSKGYQYRDHYLTLIHWAKRDGLNDPPKDPTLFTADGRPKIVT